MSSSTSPSSSKTSAQTKSKLAWDSVVSSLPLAPGVYWFTGAAGEVLYVGKAKRLKDRVSSYRQVGHLVSRIKRMVYTAKKLQFEVLESELEALLVEAELIRIHQPQFNVLLKDDKSPLYVLITDEAFPRVLMKRKKELNTQGYKGTLLGPFPSAYKLREVLRIARTIFPWCNQEGKPCFYAHIGLCHGACTGKVPVEEYQATIQQLILFLKGKKKEVIKDLEQGMEEASEKEDFEQAAIYRDRITLIASVTKRQYHLRPDFQLPQLKANMAEEGVVQLRNIISEYLTLPKTYPLKRIECYDVSNVSGTSAAVAMVTFIDGQPDTDEYRLFNIKTIPGANDYAMLQEALQRRQNHPEWGTPDLMIMDGGKGQLRAALKVWQWSVPVISIAKDPDRLILPGPGISTAAAETKGMPRYHILSLPPGHPGLNLVQRLRDEAHRFSKKQHHRRHLQTLK